MALTPPNVPVCYENQSGLRIQVNGNGSIKRIDCGDILVNLFLGTEVEGGPANIYVRRHAKDFALLPLLGPYTKSKIVFAQEGMRVATIWGGLSIVVSLRLARSAAAWFWHVTITNQTATDQTVDLIYTQDIGIAHYWAVRLNEYYVSHYIDHMPLRHPTAGVVVASRQNLSMGGAYPWVMIGSLGRAERYATDALQVYGLAQRAGGLPEGVVHGLPGIRKQHEHSMVALQEEPVTLRSGATVTRGFFGWFEPTKQEPTTEADLVFVDKARSLPEAVPPSHLQIGSGVSVCTSLFASSPLLQGRDFTREELLKYFPEGWRHEEYVDGMLLSFFTGDCIHVVLREKELRVLRPHGHILRTGKSLVPDEASLTSTVWMAGVFHSMLTQGHVNINRFLSTTHSYLSIFRSHGLRLFIELEGVWQLLDVPSAFTMAPDRCRWLYRHGAGLIEVESIAPADRHVMVLKARVVEGEPVRFLAVLHVAIGGDDGSNPATLRLTQDKSGIFVHTLPDCDLGWRFPAGGFRVATCEGTTIERVGGDELIFRDGGSRMQPFLCLLGSRSDSFGLEISGCLVTESDAASRFCEDIPARILTIMHARRPCEARLTRLEEITPWFVADALIHYLTPRGLEQYSGGGWGTRDVSQGPVEMLLALGRFDAVRDILVRVFKQQNPDGDWPQWFMFFERERGIRPPDSHGDIVFWPVLALSQYIEVSGDVGFLEESLPFFHPEGDHAAEQAPLLHHVERALALMQRRVIPGTHLAAFGNGDWNDSLQPVQPDMRDRLCSSWTVTLHYQTLKSLARAMRRAGRDERARDLEIASEKILEDFHRLLVVDGIVAGFGYFHDDGRVEYLLHPRDQRTGISYSLLPMMHAVINEMMSPAQAERHLYLIREHLLGVDGARLFDRPFAYRGGRQIYFQRAESTTFFGRENGLMYMHAHLRYAEALAHYGDAEGFFTALCKACPIALRELVPTATLRQANCYYSSSDPAFNDRYEAYAQYDRVKNGTIPFEGGWRVYSSGAGIFVRLLVQNLLGIQVGREVLRIDPVIPPAFDGLRVRLSLAGRHFEVCYRIEKFGFGPQQITVNGKQAEFVRRENPYRTGAAEIVMETLQGRLNRDVNLIEIHLA